MERKPYRKEESRDSKTVASSWANVKEGTPRLLVTGMSIMCHTYRVDKSQKLQNLADKTMP